MKTISKAVITIHPLCEDGKGKYTLRFDDGPEQEAELLELVPREYAVFRIIGTDMYYLQEFNRAEAMDGNGNAAESG